jgi:hypothetical protein
MASIIETRSNTFKFCEDHSLYLEVKITVTEKEYENKNRFYCIDYKYKLIGETDISEKEKERFYKKVHPFYYDDDHIDGEVVYKNDLTSQMVNYILMDDIELEKFTNINTAQMYRTQLMKAIVSLWD